MAQDLALFLVFFDLMLVPFYFLIGGWGSGDRVRATTKFVIYTLAGSLLMLAAAIALGVLATPEGGEISFSLAELQQRTVGERHAGVDLPAVRARLPGQGAAVPAARLGAGHLPRDPDRRCWRCSPACSRRSASTASCGSCCRSCPTPRSLPGPDARAGGVLDPLRLDPRLLAGRRAAGAGLLLDRPARLHRAGHLRLRRQGRPGRAVPDGQPRPRAGAAVPDHRARSPRARTAASRSASSAAWPSARPCWRRCS